MIYNRWSRKLYRLHRICVWLILSPRATTTERSICSVFPASLCTGSSGDYLFFYFICMPSWWPNHIKYRELNTRYHAQPAPKISYAIFANRVNVYGYSWEEAIKPWDRRGKHMIKTDIRHDGRVCTQCHIFKPRDAFARTKATSTKRTPKCKVCRNAYKKAYRARTNGATDKAYKKRTRTLEIGQKVGFHRPIYVNGLPRENVRTVIDYQFKKGYHLQSIYGKKYRRLDTNDNHTVNKNCERFYIVQ